MKLIPLFETQDVLDKRIVKEHGLEGRDLLPEKILALQVELGECANEWRKFKFWSKDQKPRIERKVRCHACSGRGSFYVGISNDEKEICLYCEGTGLQEDRNPLLEEYVDCLHFILSIGLEHEFHEKLPLEIESVTCVDVTRQFSMLMKTDWEFYEVTDLSYYREGFELFVGLGELLGFTWQQIEDAYYAKNKINHTRQASGY